MKVQITRNTVANHRPVQIGDVIELPDQEARDLINMGKARAYVETPAPAREAAVLPAAQTAVAPKPHRKSKE